MYRHLLFVWAAILCLAVLAADHTVAGDNTLDLERLRPKVTLGQVPSIEIGPRQPASEEKAKQIRTYIAHLADIDHPDFGLSPTLSGDAFLPLPDQRRSRVMLLTDQELRTSPALLALVEIGPDALPFLLEALDDPTPTKLTLEHRSVVRYQPTANIVINSPTEDVELRDQVRKIWAGDDPSRTLLDSLLLDYATRGVFQGPSLDSWALGSDLQIQAAMREQIDLIRIEITAPIPTVPPEDQ